MDTQLTTKFKILKPGKEVFEAIVDPKKIGNFWFTSSSERWEEGKKVTLTYAEYEAELVINVLEVKDHEKIVYSWGEGEDETRVAMTLMEPDDQSTLIQVTESGFKEDDPELFNKMLGQKEGWVFMLSCLKCYLEHGVNDLRGFLIH